ncbi:DUF2339 domain-containing protein [bacterium]|nr:DUF2339 domain-containing protein [bacterium]
MEEKNDQNRIEELEAKLKLLLQKQDQFFREINSISIEIKKLRAEQSIKQTPLKEEIKVEDATVQKPKAPTPTPRKEQQVPQFKYSKKEAKPSNLEKFIGENLMSTVGVIVTIIGVIIGVRYAISNNLIQPSTRILLGYITGLTLVGFAIVSKKKYHNFSASLLSGAMTILYFVTFAAYSFYSLMPQGLAFGLMLFFTVFTVIASLNYNRQIIALLGLVGAYGIPFLLSENSGRADILFTYVIIINLGILFISFKRQWRGIYITAFILSWLIFIVWTLADYSASEHFNMALIVSFSFFIIFYITYIARAYLQDFKFKPGAVPIILINSVLYYALNYSFLMDHSTGKHLLGLFTVLNGGVHLAVAYWIFKSREDAKKLFYFVITLVISFITLAIPVQLDAHYVSLLWALEASLIYWFGIKKNIDFYEKMGLILMLIAFVSCLQDLNQFYPLQDQSFNENAKSILNLQFLSSIIISVCFGWMSITRLQQKVDSSWVKQLNLEKFLSYGISAIFATTLFLTFLGEIELYWLKKYELSSISVGLNDEIRYYKNYDLLKFKDIYSMVYYFIFASILAIVNWAKIKSRELGLLNIAITTIIMAIFLLKGLYLLSELRENYIEQNLSEYFNQGSMHYLIRYIAIAFAALGIWTVWNYRKKEYMDRMIRVYGDLFLHISALWIVSSEYLHWMDFTMDAQSYRFGLSILYGVYALFMIILGIKQKKQHLRVAGLILLGLTLIKLVAYDISSLDTIEKTIVFVSLGILLLVASFLYHKFKKLIFDE